MTGSPPADHPPVEQPKIGVLLVNLGTPDATDYWSVRRYLKQFLSDPRVIETPRWLWWPILNLIILTVRPSRSGHAYAQIWDKEHNESPLKVITRRQGQKLARRFADRPEIVVDWAMRYGNPSTESRLEALRQAGCQKILVYPLYPQYSATTTGTANDEAFRALSKMRWQPAVRTMPACFEEPVYIEALARSIAEGVAALDFEPDLVVTSYHGMPVEYCTKGDPYQRQCIETTRLVKEHLGWPDGRLMVTFQSRFGRDEWLQPYTDKTLSALPGKGIKKIAILAPAFMSDCIETLEEIAIGGRELFLESGGEKFAYIPCLNDTEPAMAMIETLVRKELSGWI